MPEPSPRFSAHLARLLAALSADLSLPTIAYEILPGSYRAEMRGGLLLVPQAYVDHWNRFEVFPTGLVRDAAYSAKRRALSEAGVKPPDLEADALAYAEAFLRSLLEEDDEA